MADTLIIQSYRTHDVAPWIESCMQSVRAWAAFRGYDYRFIGDEIFDRVPQWYVDKTRAYPQIATDLGRLELIHEALNDGYRRVVWLDADVLVFVPEGFALDHVDSFAFGRELWVQSNRRGELKLYRNTHNAICVFCPDNPFLDFYKHACRSIVERLETGPENGLVPQIVGPKFLNAMQNLMGLPLIHEIGMASPLVVTDIAAGGGPALDMMMNAAQAPVCGLNMCASLAPVLVESACQRLLDDPDLLHLR